MRETKEVEEHITPDIAESNIPIVNCGDTRISAEPTSFKSDFFLPFSTKCSILSFDLNEIDFLDKSNSPQVIENFLKNINEDNILQTTKKVVSLKNRKSLPLHCSESISNISSNNTEVFFNGNYNAEEFTLKFSVDNSSSSTDKQKKEFLACLFNFSCKIKKNFNKRKSFKEGNPLRRRMELKSKRYHSTEKTVERYKKKTGVCKKKEVKSKCTLPNAQNGNTSIIPHSKKKLGRLNSYFHMKIEKYGSGHMEWFDAEKDFERNEFNLSSKQCLQSCDKNLEDIIFELSTYKLSQRYRSLSEKVIINNFLMFTRKHNNYK
ncbi:hypothetical protein HDU92_009165 [Lobulomyces angularis]|nr:hypothetical protein HDU92_009165 [Lobulomyces angularis]